MGRSGDLQCRPLAVSPTRQFHLLTPSPNLVGVGIEPTFRVFQTRANPSQLSDRLERAVRLELTILDLQSSALATWRRAQFGTEGEIRTLESSLEDSHVSSYFTSAWDASQGDPRFVVG